MDLKIKVERLNCGSYMASVDWTKGDAGKIGTPGCVAYADSDIEVYKIYKRRLEANGHTVLK